MKRRILITAFLMIATISFAQHGTRPTNRVEVEPGLGFDGFITVHLEARYNINSQWDTGLRGSMDWNGTQLSIVGDYNVAIGRHASFFCGMGMGVAHSDILNVDHAIEIYGDACCAEMEHCFYAMPRIGFEIFNRLRFTLSLSTYNLQAHIPSFSFGIAINGRKR